MIKKLVESWVLQTIGCRGHFPESRRAPFEAQLLLYDFSLRGMDGEEERKEQVGGRMDSDSEGSLTVHRERTVVILFIRSKVGLESLP